MRDTGQPVYGVGKTRTFAGLTSTRFLTKSNLKGREDRGAPPADRRAYLHNLVETDMLWGHRNDPENFHRCLQDFDRRLPDLLAALRPGDILVLTSDHGCDPTTPSTDHSREYGLLLAYVEGRNAAGRIHEGEFGDVGATANRWLGKALTLGAPQPFLEPRRCSEPLSSSSASGTATS
jgi:phosphopentomutase